MRTAAKAVFGRIPRFRAEELRCHLWKTCVLTVLVRGCRTSQQHLGFATRLVDVELRRSLSVLTRTARSTYRRKTSIGNGSRGAVLSKPARGLHTI